MTAVSGRDMRFAGANVQGANVYLDAGRDLVVASRQNQSDSSSWGFNFSVTFTPNGVPTSGTLGGSLGQASRTYTDTPTTIIANNVLDVYTGQTTFLLGAMLNSKAGKLKLDTGNFVFDHFGDKDFARNVSVQLNIDPNRPDANGSYYYHDKQGVTYATVGAGTIKIRNAPTTSLIALNRDAANIQRVVRDETINIKIPGVNLVALVNDVNNSVNYFRAGALERLRLHSNNKHILVRSFILVGQPIDHPADVGPQTLPSQCSPTRTPRGWPHADNSHCYQWPSA